MVGGEWCWYGVWCLVCLVFDRGLVLRAGSGFEAWTLRRRCLGLVVCVLGGVVSSLSGD
jgi:hypothetical protein